MAFKKGYCVVGIYIPMAQRKFKPKQISYTLLGNHRNNKRLWLEGLRLASSGFTPNVSIDFRTVPELYAATIEVGKGNHTVSGRKRTADDSTAPIIDINNKELSELYEGIDLVRVMYYDNRILIQAHSNELNAKTAIEDLEINTKAQRLSMGVIGVGGGIFCSAMKEGLADTGISLETSWVIDIEQKYLESADRNSKAINDKTILVHGDANHVETNFLTPVNIFLISNACTGFSPAGRAKNQLENPEAHKESGLMILKTIEIIERYMPPVIWHENVVSFNSSASASLLAGKLQKLGYNIQVRTCGGEFGTLEDRKRSIMVATHKSISCDLERHLVPVMFKEEKLRDVMDDVPLDDPSWKPYSYLIDKAERDKVAGKGFQLQHLTGDEPKIGVMGAGLAKARSTEPFFKHPHNPNLLRLPTVREHAAFMKIPLSLVKGNTKTTAHEILGQSGSYALVKAMGVMTGRILRKHYLQEDFYLEEKNRAAAEEEQLEILEEMEEFEDSETEKESEPVEVNLSLF